MYFPFLQVLRYQMIVFFLKKIAFSDKQHDTRGYLSLKSSSYFCPKSESP